MKKNWKIVKPEDIKDNFIKSIGYEWMLVTAGTLESWNTMTAAWGTMGFLWDRPVAISFVRPSRYTYEFMESTDYHTLSFFHKTDKAALQYCGTHSGRDVDKEKETGLVPVELDFHTVTFEQVRLAIVCKKIYCDDIKETLIKEKSINSHYPEESNGKRDLHRMYIGEVVKSYRAP